jgi:hypothetical protein
MNNAAANGVSGDQSGPAGLPPTRSTDANEDSHQLAAEAG